jgi:HEAT repeat protein
MIVTKKRVRASTLFLVLVSTTSLIGCGPTGDRELDKLLRGFQNERVFWRQSEIGQEIVQRGDPRVLSVLQPWLKHDDRRIRGNVAYIFAEFGDARGLETLFEILDDISEQRTVRLDGIPSILMSTEESFEEARERVLKSPAALRSTIKSDRYYAVHLLGELRNPDAVEMLIPLLNDDDINYSVAWALEQIGDQRPIGALVKALNHPDASVRVPVIHALQGLGAVEALPYLEALVDDPERPRFGYRGTVGQAAREAIASIEGDR